MRIAENESLIVSAAKTPAVEADEKNAEELHPDEVPRLDSYVKIGFQD